MKTQKTTNEIRVLLTNAKMDFDSVVNKALNDYLSRIFHSCPFTEELCTSKQCIDCTVFKEPHK
jgi:xanthine dehydrogenase iron-sulfur cluster and FAD-binding subunit A